MKNFLLYINFHKTELQEKVTFCKGVNRIKQKGKI